MWKIIFWLEKEIMDWEREFVDFIVVKEFVFRVCEEFYFFGGNGKYN